MTKHREFSRVLLLGCLLLFTVGPIALAHSSPSTSHNPNMATAESPTVLDGDHTKLESASTTIVPEPADAVLIQENEWHWHRALKNTMHLPDWLDLGFEHRTRFEVYDHPWRSSQPLGRTDPQIQQRSRVRLGLSRGQFQLFFEGQDSRVYLDDPGDFVNTGIKNEMDVLQAFIALTVKDFLITGFRTDLHLGRLTMDFGSRRLIARNAFRNTTNAFDGLHWQLAQDHQWRIRAFLVEPVLIDSSQLDEQSKRHVFWGTSLDLHQLSWVQLHAYYFGLNDQRSSNVSSQRTFSTFGIRLSKNPEKTEMDYEIESAWQTGKRGPTNHFAHFQHLNLGYTFDVPWSPRIVVQYDYASGDRNEGDSQDSAFDTLFGARRFEYMPTGNFGPFFRTNISSPGWRILVAPGKGWKIQVKHRVWYLATSRGAFGSSGLRDSNGQAGNFLGHDVEGQIRWIVNDQLMFEAGYTHWFKGSYFDRLPASTGLPAGGNKDTDYFYILTTIRL